MSGPGTIIALSGAKGAYTKALSEVLAELLSWRQARFSDFIRIEAIERGENPSDTRVLQKIGQQLVDEHVGDFVAGVLKSVNWTPGLNIILDGLRHADVLRELRKQVNGSCEIHVVYVALDNKVDRADRVKRSEGITDDQFTEYDQDITETQVEDTPGYTDLEVNGANPRGELAQFIVRELKIDFDRSASIDSGEAVSLLEPTRVGTAYTNLAKDLIREATDFAREVPVGLAQPLADLVRAMNCYYSNLIEGSNATPVEIELALSGDYERDPKKRHLQAEAKAHIAVQKWIDDGNLGSNSPTSVSSIITIHDRFFSEFPDPQYITNSDGTEKVLVVPGFFRQVEIAVGRHRPPSPGAILRFMERYEKVYAPIEDSEQEVVALAAAHHRLLWIHPFADGNGRVARLVSDAMLSRILQTRGLWSASRGLAQRQSTYKSHLAACDATRRGDLDGRGHLSESNLNNFTKFFLTTCLEQVRFMRKVMRLDEIEEHIDRWIDASADFGDDRTNQIANHKLDPSAGSVLKALLKSGPLTLSECHKFHTANADLDKAISQLKYHGFLREKGGKLCFVLPPHRAERFLPGLFR